ncbi:alpha/beta fold hydrolase [Actinokineospora bangkokensis]|uniref:Alpha/beta hydrolase n=1 Tax=Actinokineospora bangkokensis TaxID=1193682 RepID=A0A1Q9LJY3_9PSEU|nr:alpha/beta hydrolase [Actinokineospora bangkokensis]OLR92313.1 alpha/beta hydrolase [Actinokineospora bangkokensis]
MSTHVQRLPGGREDAPLVVFVHGLLTDSLASYYFTLAPDLAAAGVDVLMYDLRGHGRTDRPATGYRLERFVDDLANLLDALGERRPAHVVGNSFGGTIAAGLAAWYPEKVATATMIESEPPTATWTRHMSAGLADAKARLAEEVVINWIEDNHGEHTARLSRGASTILASTTLAEDIPHSRVIGDDLAELTCPLLAVFGDESGLSEQVPDLRARLPRCRTVVLPEQGHSVLIEKPTETRDLVLGWVREHHAAVVAAR